MDGRRSGMGCEASARNPGSGSVPCWQRRPPGKPKFTPSSSPEIWGHVIPPSAEVLQRPCADGQKA